MSELEALLERISNRDKPAGDDHWMRIAGDAARILPDLAKRLRDAEEISIERRDLLRESVALNNEVIAKNGHLSKQLATLTAELTTLRLDRDRLAEALEKTECRCVYGIPDMRKIPAHQLMAECGRCAALAASRPEESK